MEKLKQNIALVVGLSIPLLMMLIIAGVIYLPRWMNSTPPPRYDFLYAVGDGVQYFAPQNYYAPAYPPYPTKGVWPKYTYRVLDGKLVRQTTGPVPKEYGTMPEGDVSPKFYVYHVGTKKSSEITFDDAALYTLDSGVKSPDGFDIVRGQGSGDGFPFFFGGGNNYNKQYIHKGQYAEELSLNLPENYYGDFFIAWITNPPHGNR